MEMLSRYDSSPAIPELRKWRQRRLGTNRVTRAAQLACAKGEKNPGRHLKSTPDLQMSTYMCVLPHI